MRLSSVKRNVSFMDNTHGMDVVWHQVDKELDRREKTWAWLARQLGETDQTVNNWKRRGVPARQHAAIAHALGWSIDRLLGLTDTVIPDIGNTLMAHPVVLDALTVVPTISWEDLMGPLPTVFKLSAPDSSMAPRVPQGTLVEFTREIEPRPGDGVLVQDGLGHHYIRLYRLKRPGHWEAHAVNDAYQSMDSKEDALKVVAVLTAVAGRWS